MEINNLWAIDRLEDNIAILENINTKEKQEISINILPENIKEGSIISYQNNTYQLELTEEEKRRQEILRRFHNLRNNKN